MRSITNTVLEGHSKVVDMWQGNKSKLGKFLGTYARPEAPVMQVNGYLMIDLIRRAGFKQLSFLSLDVEGSEFEVLKSFPFRDMPIAAIAVEMGSVAYPRVHDVLTRNSFLFIGFCAQRYDAIYVSTVFNELLSRFPV